jgi:acyl-CoA synthetase (AMP-forming)/AMP-acid ligase II
MFKLLYALYKIKLLSPLGVYRLIAAIFRCGINPMALLYFAQSLNGDKVALVYDNEAIGYDQLLSESEALSNIFIEKYQLKRGRKVGLFCKNHAPLVKAIFAASITGADLYLLNAEMGKEQFNHLLNKYDIDLLVYDYELSELIEQSEYRKEKLLSEHDDLPAINNMINISASPIRKYRATSMGKLLMLTGGTTGNFKVAAHKPSLFRFLNPFLTFITKLKLLEYNTVYIATPIYHGYGAAVLFVFIALGKKIVIHKGFDTKKACALIREHNVEVVSVVPLMLHNMLEYNAEDLKSLSCIASGGAQLNPKLIEETFCKLGDVLYNLYGTSEAGLNMIATPKDLKYSALTIGKKIETVKLKILDQHNAEVKIGEIGQFCIKNSWSMKNNQSAWIKTGDLGYMDPKGYYFLCGRVDDMIVSAGENVYPVEVEQILLKHTQIDDVAVIGICDENFGQRLKVFVRLKENTDTTKEEIFEWLRSRVARFQMPKEIVFVETIPYTSLGKKDKKQLNN